MIDVAFSNKSAIFVKNPLVTCSGSSFFLVAGGTGDHAVQGDYGRDALDNYHQGAKTKEQKDQGTAYENLVGSAA